VENGFVAYVSKINGKIYYDKWENDQFKEMYMETYEEALKKVCL
jgi:hypothetical protein